jgi:hypothetical protein
LVVCGISWSVEVEVTDMIFGGNKKSCGWRRWIDAVNACITVNGGGDGCGGDFG